jgi:hypothetical protein
MDDNKHNAWDIIIKAAGFLATAASIYLGISQFSSQQTNAREAEISRNFWLYQNQVYSEVCKSAGRMAANLDNDTVFTKAKASFMEIYYGEMIRVENSKVDSLMRELRYYTDILDPKDPDMQNVFKRKVIELAEACKTSSQQLKDEVDRKSKK